MTITKERPVLMNGEMVRATLRAIDPKTQTRRLIDPVPMMVTEKVSKPWEGDPAILMELLKLNGRKCKYGQPGDRLYVRETYQYYDWNEDGQPCIRYCADGVALWKTVVGDDDVQAAVIDIWSGLSEPANYDIDQHARDRRWRPNIHHPRWASRIDLEITGLRIERLQDISEDDAKAEGCQPLPWVTTDVGDLIDWPLKSLDRPYANSFAMLWESISGPGSWNANPWVWVVEFKRIEKEVAA